MDVLLVGSIPVRYFWLQPYDFAEAINQLTFLHSFGVQFGFTGYFGEGFNSGFRNTPWEKVVPANFTSVGDWLLAH